MSTKKFRNLIEKIRNKILISLDTDIIIIGENTSGKSDLILSVIKTCMSEGSPVDGTATNLPIIYFIDSVNRNFNIKLVGAEGESKEISYKEIIKKRYNPTNFNKADTFGGIDIEALYWKYEERLNELLSRFWNVIISIKIEEGALFGTSQKFQIIKNGKTLSEDNEPNIPNGIQAVMRIFLELLFFQKCVETEENGVRPLVLIEELDLFLSEKYSAQILNFIKQEFPDFRFVVTAHSRDLVLETGKADVIALMETDYRRIEQGVNYRLEVEEIFAEIFHTEDSLLFTNDDEVDRFLRVLLNRKMNDMWEGKDTELLNGLKEKRLLSHHRYLIHEIEEWKNE